MVDLYLCMYSLIGHIPSASIASATRRYSQFPSSACWVVIPAIRWNALLWNPYNTFKITLVTTQLSLPYIINVFATDLYNIPRDRTVAPVCDWIVQCHIEPVCWYHHDYEPLAPIESSDGVKYFDCQDPEVVCNQLGWVGHLYNVCCQGVGWWYCNRQGVGGRTMMAC